MILMWQEIFTQVTGKYANFEDSDLYIYFVYGLCDRQRIEMNKVSSCERNSKKKWKCISVIKKTCDYLNRKRKYFQDNFRCVKNAFTVVNSHLL